MQLWLIAAAAVGWLGCGKSVGEQPAVSSGTTSAAPVDVVVVSPTLETVERQVVLPASVEAFETTTLQSRVSGYLGRIDVDIGDRVERGQVIAKIDVPELVDQLRLAEADLAANHADRASAKSELGRREAEYRLRKLTHERIEAVQKAEPDVVSQQAVDEARAEFEVARATVDVARGRISQIDSRVKQVEAEIERLRTLIGFSEVRAPFKGIVTNRYVHTGALLHAAMPSRPGHGIVTVASLDIVRLLVDVAEGEVAFVQAGDLAAAEFDAVPGRQFQGTVTRFAGALAPSSRTMRAEIHLANPGWLLRPGMYGRVTLTLEERSEVVTIPAEAVRVDGATTYVYRVMEGRAKRTEVGTDTGDGITVEVTAGLSGSERVVLSARGALEDGARVSTVESRSEERQ